MYKKVLVPADVTGLAESTLDHVKARTKEGFVGEVTQLNVVKLKFPSDLHLTQAHLQR